MSTKSISSKSVLAEFSIWHSEGWTTEKNMYFIYYVDILFFVQVTCSYTLETKCKILTIFITACWWSYMLYFISITNRFTFCFSKIMFNILIKFLKKLYQINKSPISLNIHLSVNPMQSLLETSCNNEALPYFTFWHLPGRAQYHRISTVALNHFDALPCFSHDIHPTLSMNCKYISFNPNVPCLNVILTNSMQNITFC